MTKVPCSVAYTEEPNEDGYYVDAVAVECRRCGHTETAFGQHSGSVKRCLAQLNENCPEGENNFYEVDQ